MVIVSCPAAPCEYETEDVSETLACKLLELHVQVKHSTPAPMRGPKLTRPTVDRGESEESWNEFQRRWENFKRGSRIGNDEASSQLFDCASFELSSMLLKLDQGITTLPEDEVMLKMRSLAVIPMARGVLRAELMKLEQDEGENFRAFTARVKGKADTCSFSVLTDCVCGRTVKGDYTAETMRDVLLAGIADLDIRHEALSCEGLSSKPIDDLVSFVERREMSRSATTSKSISAISTFRREKRKPAHNPTANAEMIPCPGCHKSFKPYRFGKRGWNQKPFKICRDCWRKEHVGPTKVAANVQSTPAIPSGSDDSDQVDSFVLSHVIISNDVLREVSVSRHPRVALKLKFAKCGKTVQVSGIADTGANQIYGDFAILKVKALVKKT